MVEDINGILNSGEVPNLFAEEDMQRILSACRPLAKEAGKGEGGGAFAAAAFADDGDGFSGHHGEIDAFDRFGGFGSVAFETDAEVFDFEERRGVRRHRDAGGE
jgi:hypothetical protein